ncbi:MAG: MFS transporter [Anaerolineae bacterium]|nr:MFS transporter [Anaerolineae bacterium]
MESTICMTANRLSLARIPQTLHRYPRQLWLLFAGFLINRASSSMIWPFLTIYMREQLRAPLSTISLLFTVQAVAGLTATMLIGPAMDRIGRKRIMIVSLLTTSAILIGMQAATSLPAWIVLIALYGMSTPIFTVGGNAMVADVVDDVHQRTEAYALIRMAQNLGIAIGPAVGGALIVVSYSLTYYLTAFVNVLLAGFIIVFLTETLGPQLIESLRPPGGYGPLLRDRAFMIFCAIFVLIQMIVALVFGLLSVYAKENFGIPENQYGLIVVINAVMVVLFQYRMTRFTQRFRHLTVMAAGSLLYALGVVSIALGSSFAAFAVSMVIITLGELMVFPTTLALVAHMAPAGMRARYMSIYSLTYTVAMGIAPVFGGFLNDWVAPAAIWYGGMLLGLAAALCFLLLMRTDLISDQ